MRFGSVCSGIEAASVAWQPLGWQPVFYSEIAKFPRAVLRHYHSDVPIFGDFTAIRNNHLRRLNCESIELIVGGTPCQSFSVAGLGAGLADERGNLTLEFIRLVKRTKPRWVLWENVPGVLSNDGGRAFGSFLGGLAKCGYGFAYRVLDAQYFGVPQRRRRVFVVGYIGDWRPAAAVLFERESLRGDITPRREPGKSDTAGVVKGAAIGRKPENGPQYGEFLTDGTCYTLNCSETHAVIAFNGRQDPISSSVAPPVDTFSQTQCVAFVQNGRDEVRLQGGDGQIAGALAANHGIKQQTYVEQGGIVRRLTPLECERLQGFPDNYTLINYNGKPASDAARYEALGNSMAVDVMRWIGQRIELIDNLKRSL